MDRDQVVEHLAQLPTEEMVDLLRRVFARRQPGLEEAAFCRNKFYLGTAWSDLESDAGQSPVWGRWKRRAVAYPDPAEHGDDLGPDWGLVEAGICGICGSGVCSNLKQGICPICGSKVYMT